MLIKRFYLLLFFIGYIWTCEPVFIGEELQYSVSFRFIPAGKSIISFNLDSLNGEPMYKLTTSIKTNSFVDNLYKVRDHIETWINKENFSLQKVVQEINQGDYHRKYYYEILDDSVSFTNSRKIKIPGIVYDPISFVYYLRNEKLFIGKKYNFFSITGKKIREVIVNITDIETINVPAGTFRCLIIEPISGDENKLLKNDGNMRFWISDDNLKIPIKIEQNTNVGTLIMKLQEIKNIK